MTRLSLPDLEAVVDGWAALPEAWRPLVRHERDERVYSVLHRDDRVELYMVCWSAGHDTGFHDHDESAAAIFVVEGALTEERLALGGTVERSLEAGERLTIGQEAIHRVRHAGRRPAVSLHAYSPPLQRVGTYEVADNGALLRHSRAPDVPLAAVA